MSNEKLDKLYPKTFISKMAEKVKRDKDVIKNQESAKHEISAMPNKKSLISREGMYKLCQEMEEKLKSIGSMSPDMLIEKEAPSDMKDALVSAGMEFFLIEGFKTLVSIGRIIDEDISDNPMKNHVYRHKDSRKSRVVRNVGEDSALALDDD